MSMELTVTPITVQVVEFNETEFNEAVAAIVERYAGIVAVDKAQAKNDRAQINHILKQIDETRKTVKRQYEAPLKDFEAKLKNIVEPLQKVKSDIDAQVKEWEEEERAERREALECVFASECYDFSLDFIFKASWLNASTSLAKASKELKDAADAAQDDINAIKSLADTPMKLALLEKYMSGSSLAECLAFKARAEAQTFTIDTVKTVSETIAELEDENPRNTYTVTENGIEVVAVQHAYTIQLSCSEAIIAEIERKLDALNVFYVIS